MERNLRKSAIGNEKKIVCIVMLAIVSFFLGGPSVSCAGDELLQIENISKYYARGSDAVLDGAGRDEAIEWIRKGFTEDCIFTFYSPDGSVLNQLDGIVDYIDNFVVPVFSAYRFSFHAVSNMLVEEINGNSAKLHTYGVATLIREDKSQDAVVAFYVDDVIREKGVWKSYKRDCFILANDMWVPDASFTE